MRSPRRVDEIEPESVHLDKRLCRDGTFNVWQHFIKPAGIRQKSDGPCNTRPSNVSRTKLVQGPSALRQHLLLRSLELFPDLPVLSKGAFDAPPRKEEPARPTYRLVLNEEMSRPEQPNFSLRHGATVPASELKINPS